MSVISVLNNKVGQTLNPLGQFTNTNRIAKTGEGVETQAHGRYHEATQAGQQFVVSNGATGQAPGTALGVHPPILLYNPLGSGVKLSINKVTGGYISGTLGAGTIFHAIFTLNGPVGSQTNVIPVVGSGASLTNLNGDVSSPSDSTSISFANGTLNANPVLLYPFATINAELATTATNPTQLLEDVEGTIVLEPGSGYCLEAIAAAGTTPLMSFGVSYEKIPIV